MSKRSSDGDDGWVQREAIRVLRAMDSWERAMGDYSMDGLIIKEIRVRGPHLLGTGYQLVIKGVSEDGQAFVAFGGGDTFKEALASTASKMETQGLKFKPDQPYDAGKASGGKQ